MTGFPIPPWVVAAAAAVMLATILYFTIKAYLATRIDWRPLPVSNVRDVYYAGAVDPNRLAAAVSAAAMLLANKTKWGDLVYAGLTNIHVYVVPTNSWVDSYGRKVAGEAGAFVEVGLDLAALLHEFGHVLEARLDLRDNPDHIGWETNGILASDFSYQAWRMGEGSVAGGKPGVKT
jgi:hypothetical protein